MAKNLTIQDEPVYNEQMEALEPTTPAHADYFNERYAQLLNNGKANRRDAKIFEDDVNGGKMRLGWKTVIYIMRNCKNNVLRYNLTK